MGHLVNNQKTRARKTAERSELGERKKKSRWGNHRGSWGQTMSQKTVPLGDESTSPPTYERVGTKGKMRNNLDKAVTSRSRSEKPRYLRCVKKKRNGMLCCDSPAPERIRGKNGLARGVSCVQVVERWHAGKAKEETNGREADVSISCEAANKT